MLSNSATELLLKKLNNESMKTPRNCLLKQLMLPKHGQKRFKISMTNGERKLMESYMDQLDGSGKMHLISRREMKSSTPSSVTTSMLPFH
jgi:hypothetical protein